MYERDGIALGVPPYRYTKGRCRYCGEPIHWRAKACPAHRDLVIHDPLDVRYRPPEYPGMRGEAEPGT